MAAGANGVGAGTWGLGLAVVAAVIAGGLYMSGVMTPPTPPETVADPAPVKAASPFVGTVSEQDAEPSRAAAVESVPKPEPEPTPELSPPEFDVVRVEPDGSAVIAGKAAPGSTVTVLLDETEHVVVQAGADGAFVSLLTLPVSDAPRVLTLTAKLDDQVAASADQIILAPSPVAAPDVDPETPTSPPETVAQEATEEPNEVASLPVESTETEPANNATTEQVATEPTEPASSGDVSPASEAALSDAAAEQQAEGQGETEAPEVVTAKLMDESAAPAVSQPAVAPNEGSEAPEVNAASSQSEADTAEGAGLADDTPTEMAQSVTEPEQVVSAPADEPETAVSPPEPATVLQEDEPSPVANAPATEPVAEPKPAPVAVLRAGADGVELVQPATPEKPSVMETIALDTISYSDAGDVLLSGRAQGQSVVRIYLDNDSVTDFGVDNTGRWKGRLDNVEPGVYTLRLDELDGEGKVLSRLETPFKREAPEVLQPPATETLAETPLIRAVTVQAGDTLWAISRKRYGDGVLYVRVFEANRDSIRNPDLIYPGQVFSIPE